MDTIEDVMKRIWERSLGPEILVVKFVLLTAGLLPDAGLGLYRPLQ